MKRKIFFVIFIMFVLTVGLLSACSDKTNSKKSTDSSSDLSNMTEAGKFPIVEEPVELNVLVAGIATVESFEDNEFTRWYEELTNVRINWEVAPIQSVQEVLNIRLASGDLPDVLLHMGVSPTQQMIYGAQQGMFLPLNDYIDKYGYYVNQMFEAEPLVKEVATAPDGNIYTLPEQNDCFHCKMAVKMWVYQPWLDKLGLDVPTTTDDFYEMLKAFKEKDPNGNGKADEIPFAGDTQTWNGQVEQFIMNSFVYNPPSRIYLDNGKVNASFNQEGWKEGLKYLNKLYSEGLLADESFTQDTQQLRQMAENPDIPILGAAPAGTVSSFTQFGGESKRFKEFKTIPPLEGPNGLRQSVYEPYQIGLTKFVITNQAKHPEVAFRWADGLFSEEIMLRMNYGVPGENWEEAEEGAIGIDGNPAKLQIIGTGGTTQSNHWDQAAPTYRTNEFRLGWVTDNPEEDLESILYKETLENSEPYHADLEMALPPLFFTDEQSAELTDIQTTIDEYVDEMVARFTTGDVDIDSEWDTYIQTLESMNLSRYLELYQTVYDASGN
ncbi:extracellular solute-binding protein [Lederbergia lenta]|uniref:Sugar ABC transporter substrate-binding protein n=1 Tax=Lederbergia lenta TaxID=1467 RepID=A0A2X4VU56_LEDLE|nr:extracellular solute-binding protein [Lederbergia lenta]MCM3110881.1 extracellular solute-binding protein [Lederbergia lenta]MEC2325723.1 extracellular solute-binding protein [Lederbergia lenta]SQI53859.1 sugar ABC transporter substrate-binding protein [Lederbergia lenta]